jgi:hypothetical protein
MFCQEIGINITLTVYSIKHLIFCQISMKKSFKSASQQFYQYQQN